MSAAAIDASKPLTPKTRNCLPPVEALRVSQDRLLEKELFTRLKIPTPPFRAVETLALLQLTARRFGRRRRPRND